MVGSVRRLYLRGDSRKALETLWPRSQRVPRQSEWARSYSDDEFRTENPGGACMSVQRIEELLKQLELLEPRTANDWRKRLVFFQEDLESEVRRAQEWAEKS